MGYGLLHLIYFSYTFVGMLGFIAAPFIQGFLIAYLIVRAKATGQFGVLTAVITSTVLLTLLLFVIWGEGLGCFIMAAPIWLAFSIVGQLLGKNIAKRAQRQLLALGILPLTLVAAYHLDNVVKPPDHFIQTSIDIDARPFDIWPLLFELDGLGEPDTWYFRAGVACPLGTSTDFSTNTRRCHLTTGDLVERIEISSENREVRWQVLHTPDSMKEWNPFKNRQPPHVAHSFRVLSGGFRLERLSAGRTKLTGWTTYHSDLAPDLYWDIWNRMFVRGVQRRVMEAIAKKLGSQAQLTSSESK